ncbi:glucose 1-dehydrogenase [Peribacillus cavernae]|uniref:Glucose 1-dehydrogenase n=1 Tax=Peribacillus cavernae TaxID=1674310 RepID=A0A433HFP6_9BACI|nr:glucose 1-dehydrogenase [Peribacillus cavernae]MDQ0219449.1 NAD(P)-dependent dehydrogenase (short-subunit alcohol dehydrogenase family) [Peribacillus cavernae]RUQ27128.1 glucose 1-dehydrogenase [Peribacillus cavernae]
MLENFDLTGKVALVTGGTRGLGQSMAKALGQAGAAVIVTGRSDKTIEESCSYLKENGITAYGFRCDMQQSADLKALKQYVVEKFCRLDILVNNAGIVIDRHYAECTDEEINEIISTNLVGVMKCTRVLGEMMIKQGNGKIVNIASMDGIIGTPRLVAYGTSKGGVIQFTRGLAVEWARYGIHVNAICPGYFATSINERVLAEESIRTKILKRIPLRRVGKPEELGPLVVYLSSKASDFMTGQAIVIDGGETVH